GPNATLRTAGRDGMWLYLVPIDGGPPVRLPAGKHVGYSVAWSPRGDELAYSGDGGIFVISPDGTGRRQISLGGDVQWSADGAQLAFPRAIKLRNGFTHRYRAFAVVKADGTGFHLVTTHAYTEGGVVWSPRGRRILYDRGDQQGIYVIGAD